MLLECPRHFRRFLNRRPMTAIQLEHTKSFRVLPEPIGKANRTGWVCNTQKTKPGATIFTGSGPHSLPT